MELSPCPFSLTIIRHGESETNALTTRKKQDPLYIQFMTAYNRDWQSLETRTLAVAVKQQFFTGVGQQYTSLSGEGRRQSRATGMRLREISALPDAVFLSISPRTRETFESLMEGWPELRSVKEIYIDNRLREQEHGLITVYSDISAMFAIYPDQRQLYDAEGKYFYRFPNGENMPDTELRVGLWLKGAIRKFAGKRIMVFSHFRAILAIRMILERLSPEEFIRINNEDGPINCGVTIYMKEPARRKLGDLVLQCYNKKLYD